MIRALLLAGACWALPVSAMAQTSGDQTSMDDMAGMDMSGMDMGGHDHAGHAGPKPPASPAPSHDMSEMDGMDMPASPATEPKQGPPPPVALSGPAHAADAFYPAGEMASARMAMMHEMGSMPSTMVLLDRLEAQSGKGTDGWAWEADARTGGDTDRLWIKSEGEAAFHGGLDSAEVQALWSHAIGPWFDAQAGVREVIAPGPNRTQATVGIEGLAPYMFDVEARAFLSTHGELTGRIEADHDIRVTQRLILQPRIEANVSAQDMPNLRTGAGLTSLEAGLRLRYEVAREFAPYVGVEWQKSFGRTADYMRASGDDPDRPVAVIGIRAWF
ncbi:copper resistance protein B [Novosphingobium sp. 9]|uniref:copper resistance protein B n=1 Tax=Novosphingobium sp. 9 TaxID=2025349 RepID=UPI0021B58F89|nr:copper resistance protein B [Novosphingobium sp. 9]